MLAIATMLLVGNCNAMDNSSQPEKVKKSAMIHRGFVRAHSTLTHILNSAMFDEKHNEKLKETAQDLKFIYKLENRENYK
jgi:hypothetical protein